jgi:hypothetical protein
MIGLIAATVIMLPVMLGVALVEWIERCKESCAAALREERSRKAVKYIRDTREEDEARTVWVEPEETTTQENA